MYICLIYIYIYVYIYIYIYHVAIMEMESNRHEGLSRFFQNQSIDVCFILYPMKKKIILPVSLPKTFQISNMCRNFCF